MTTLTQWSIRHHVSIQALAELRTILGEPSAYVPPPADDPLSEAAISNLVRLDATDAGARLWRNNVGAGKLENGSYVRWGLCNDTPQLNKVCKSHDLIGIRPILITQAHVGSTIGQFISRETKRSDWRYTGTEHEIAQLNWAQLINAMGGDAQFATGKGTFK